MEKRSIYLSEGRLEGDIRHGGLGTTLIAGFVFLNIGKFQNVSFDMPPKRRRGSSISSATSEESPLKSQKKDVNDGNSKGGKAKPKKTTPVVETTAVLDEEEEMRRLLGFSAFNTTAGKEVKDNSVGPSRGHAKINKKREYRQYLNKDQSKNKHG